MSVSPSMARSNKWPRTVSGRECKLPSVPSRSPLSPVPSVPPRLTLPLPDKIPLQFSKLTASVPSRALGSTAPGGGQDTLTFPTGTLRDSCLPRLTGCTRAESRLYPGLSPTPRLYGRTTNLRLRTASTMFSRSIPHCRLCQNCLLFYG